MSTSNNNISCKYCGTTINLITNYKNGVLYTQKICKVCRSELRNFTRKNPKIFEHTCLICGKIFTNDRKDAKYCNFSCFKKAPHPKGADNPRYGIKRPEVEAWLRSEESNKKREEIKQTEEYKKKHKEGMLRTWASKEGILRKEKQSILIKSLIEQKKFKQHNKEWWESSEGIEKRKEISERNKAINMSRYEEFCAYGLLGAKAQRKISSIETKLAEALKENFIKFEQQWKYKLGIADFIIKPYIIIFVDGDYWHNYPYGDLKDKIQTQYLQQQGFIVLRFWERDILSNLDNIIRIIKSFYKFKTNKRFLDTSYNEYFSNLHGNVV